MRRASASAAQCDPVRLPAPPAWPSTPCRWHVADLESAVSRSTMSDRTAIFGERSEATMKIAFIGGGTWRRAHRRHEARRARHSIASWRSMRRDGSSSRSVWGDRARRRPMLGECDTVVLAVSRSRCAKRSRRSPFLAQPLCFRSRPLRAARWRAGSARTSCAHDANTPALIGAASPRDACRVSSEQRAVAGEILAAVGQVVGSTTSRASTVTGYRQRPLRLLLHRALQQRRATWGWTTRRASPCVQTFAARRSWRGLRSRSCCGTRHLRAHDRAALASLDADVRNAIVKALHAANARAKNSATNSIARPLRLPRGARCGPGRPTARRAR